MHMLALETTGPHCSAALMDQGETVSEQISPGTMNHLQHLMPSVDRLLHDGGLQLSDLTAIAVSEGPGSFTGIRIGVSSARALAQVLGCPVVPVPTLDAFGFHAPGHEGLICPMLDARRNQVYAGAYRWAGPDLAAPVPGGPYLLEEYLALLLPQAQACKEQPLLFFGDGVNCHETAIRDWALAMQLQVAFAGEDNRFQRASSVARLGKRLWERQGGRPYWEVLPNYMRKAEAQQRLEEGRIGPFGSHLETGGKPCRHG